VPQGFLFPELAGPELAGEIWQRRFYDFNVWTERRRIEKTHSMHAQSRQAWIGEPARTLGVEQLSGVCLRRTWTGTDQ
jgi:hypothetical protein